MDKIFIRDLLVRCIIGINDIERKEKQDVVINIDIFTDVRKAARSDAIEDAVDYKKLKKDILSAVENSKFFLVETLAEKIAEICLQYKDVQKVKVSVEKPGALRFARTVGVEIERKRGE